MEPFKISRRKHKWLLSGVISRRANTHTRTRNVISGNLSWSDSLLAIVCDMLACLAVVLSLSLSARHCCCCRNARVQLSLNGYWDGKSIRSNFTFVNTLAEAVIGHILRSTKLDARLETTIPAHRRRWRRRGKPGTDEENLIIIMMMMIVGLMDYLS
jgi:hypothetical protein